MVHTYSIIQTIFNFKLSLNQPYFLQLHKTEPGSPKTELSAITEAGFTGLSVAEPASDH